MTSKKSCRQAGVAPAAAARPPVVVFAIEDYSFEDALIEFATQAHISLPLPLPTSLLLINKGRI